MIQQRKQPKNDNKIIWICVSVLLLMALLTVCDVHIFHSESDWIVEKEPTCADGLRYKVCTECGERVEEETLEAVTEQHTVDWIVDKAATCTETGTKHKECMVCGEMLETDTIPASHHTGKPGANCSVCGQSIPLYTRDVDYIYFGEYPQTLKASNVTITSTTDSRGYYLGSDGAWYAKVTASPHNSGYTFSTGATVASGTVYYFKVKPIRWRILSEGNGTAFILCDSIIANHRYDDSSNNYANSEIRAWLNETFYETAFTDLQQAIILTTTVDNSVASTGYSSNRYACADTQDKVFLLSYKEVTNSAYGFSSDTARRMQTSDYSRATGAYMHTSSASYYGNGSWWLRSPRLDNSDGARFVDLDGHIRNFHYVDSTSEGVVPALQIRL